MTDCGPTRLLIRYRIGPKDHEAREPVPPSGSHVSLVRNREDATSLLFGTYVVRINLMIWTINAGTHKTSAGYCSGELSVCLDREADAEALLMPLYKKHVRSRRSSQRPRSASLQMRVSWHMHLAAGHGHLYHHPSRHSLPMDSLFLATPSS